MTTTTLAEFLLARYAEQAEHATSMFGPVAKGSFLILPDRSVEHEPDPAAVYTLADVEAKRQIVAMWQKANANREGTSDIESVLDDVLRLLALPHADHPDYREEWKP